MRQLPSEQTQAIAEVAWRYRSKGVIAFDLAGPEFGFSSKLHKAAFDIVRSRCVNCTLHSGEAAGWESIRDSIRYCGAHRIGHGVRLTQNEKLMNYIIDKRIAIESCPTSNVHTKAVQKIEDHPIKKFFDAGVIVVPCTDNKTVSNVTLSSEYDVLQKKFGFSVENMVRMMDYGFASAFVTPSEKKRLRADCFHECLKVLISAGIDVSSIVANPYYAQIGVDWRKLGVSSPAAAGVIVPGILKRQEPAITKEIIAALPKTDLHCRLDGSLSIPQLWKELVEAKVDLAPIIGKPVNSLEELHKVMETFENSTNPSDISIAKKITTAVLQEAGQIERALTEVIANAVRDNVLYLELVVRPLSHTHGGLTAHRVLEIVENKCKSLMKEFPVTVGIVVNASTVVDDPISFHEIAKLAVEFKETEGSLVVGFGCYGDTPIHKKAIKYFRSTFEFLKEHDMSVAMVAGIENAEDILGSIHEGGASRLSGAFALHTFPNTMIYLARHSIPIEMGWTPRMKFHTQDASFAGNAMRIFIENDVPVTVCTFRSRGDIASTRTESFFNIAQECKMKMADLLKLISNGFRFNFQSHTVLNPLLLQFWQKSKVICEKNGFENMIDAFPFPGEI